MSETAQAPACPSAYVHFCVQPLRYNDLDPLGHVTSLSVTGLFETPRVLYFAAAGHRVDDPRIGWMLVNLQVNFLGQVHFPASPRIGTRIEKIGRTSVITSQGLFVDDTCRATLLSTLVRVDRETDRPSEIPQDVRDALLGVDSGPNPFGVLQ